MSTTLPNPSTHNPEAASPEGHLSDQHGHGGHDDHHGPAWLAHHFDTPEQQFDSGKLGMWLFLVTEILFFSGMFCAYAIFRMLKPEVFVGCSEFLNTQLGAINTGVLLFSSLTMALAVRAAQLEQQKHLIGYLAATLSCAAIFLGVKTIEYTHKWGLGLLPAGLFKFNPADPHAHYESAWWFGWSYLTWLCLPALLLTIGVIVWGLLAKVRGKDFQFEVAKPLTVVCLMFFAGVGLGILLESGESEAGHHEAHAAVHDGAGSGHGDDHDHVGHDEPGDIHSEAGVPVMEGHGELAAEVGKDVPPVQKVTADSMAIDPEAAALVDRLAADATNTGVRGEIEALQTQNTLARGQVVGSIDASDPGIESLDTEVMTKRQAGVFFSIYYCMTGIHAIHILAGIGVLVWLLVRAVRDDFNKRYFGPVDYVGLYWHIVDLIWIYLFPLLYLIR